MDHDILYLTWIALCSCADASVNLRLSIPDLALPDHSLSLFCSDLERQQPRRHIALSSAWQS